MFSATESSWGTLVSILRIVILRGSTGYVRRPPTRPLNCFTARAVSLDLYDRYADSHRVCQTPNDGCFRGRSRSEERKESTNGINNIRGSLLLIIFLF